MGIGRLALLLIDHPRIYFISIAQIILLTYILKNSVRLRFYSIPWWVFLPLLHAILLSLGGLANISFVATSLLSSLFILTTPRIVILDRVIRKFLLGILILQIIDLLCLNVFGFSPWVVFSNSGYEGYRNPQLFVNEPNWLATFVFSLVFLNRKDPVPLNLTLLALLIVFILESRIFILLILWYGFKRMRFLFALSGTIFFAYLIAIDSSWVYDLSDFSRNPRLNDFLAIQSSQGISFYGDIGSVYKGSLNAISWREPGFVLNSIITTWIFDFGVFSLLLLAIPLKLLLVLSIHNFAYKPIWALVGYMYVCRESYRKAE